MAKYKINVSFEKKNFFWIIVENGNIINENPIKEDLILTKVKSYNKTNICEICREEFEIDGKELTYKSILYPGNANRWFYKDRNETGKWMCKRHHGIYYQRYNSNSPNNMKKYLRDCRTGNLDPNSTNAKGNLFQELTCKWRSTISTIPVEDLNKKLDNCETPIDHSWDSELGFIQTGGKTYDHYDQCWKFGHLERDWNKKFNNMICYCASKDLNIIERAYIFPIKEINNKRKSIGIYKNPSRGTPWYEKYRIRDEETIKKINDIWKEVIKERRN